MTNKNTKTILTIASVTTFAIFILSGEDKIDQQKRTVSSVAIKEVKKQPTLPESESHIKNSNKENDIKVSAQSGTVEAPAPYFLNSDNFKEYDEILYKVIRSPEEKSKFKLSLLDYRSLQSTADYIKNPSSKPGKEEKIYHMKASGFLIKAISTHPNEYEVYQAIKEVLNTNLSEAKESMSSEAYALLKENKAELMYHALAVSEEIQNTYSADVQDDESQKLLKKVQDLHSSNKSISENMIADL